MAPRCKEYIVVKSREDFPPVEELYTNHKHLQITDNEIELEINKKAAKHIAITYTSYKYDDWHVIAHEDFKVRAIWNPFANILTVTEVSVRFPLDSEEYDTMHIARSTANFFKNPPRIVMATFCAPIRILYGAAFVGNHSADYCSYDFGMVASARRSTPNSRRRAKKAQKRCDS